MTICVADYTMKESSLFTHFSVLLFYLGSYLLHSGKHNMWGLTRGRARKMLGAT
jgi:hypothetical protein